MSTDLNPGQAAPPPMQAPQPPKGAIWLENVDKRFGEKQVLRGFTAALPAHGALALMGPSGSGKTTLVRILTGLERPDAGRVRWAQDPRFCCVFQEDRLCEHLSAIENVALVLPRAQRAGVPDALRAVGLAGEELTRPVESLSGGERRRVALVRAVEAPGDVLVLDEAFKGLDETSRELAYGYIRGNLRGRLLLLVTHDTAEAEAFGAQVIRLAHGRAE